MPDQRAGGPPEVTAPFVLFPDGLDQPTAMHLAATMARAGMHDLMPWFSPDANRVLDPLDDPEVRTEVRRFVGRLWLEARRLANVK